MLRSPTAPTTLRSSDIHSASKRARPATTLARELFPSMPTLKTDVVDSIRRKHSFASSLSPLPTLQHPPAARLLLAGHSTFFAFDQQPTSPGGSPLWQSEEPAGEDVDAPGPFDEDLDDEKEERLQQERELEVPLDEPWTKCVPSVFDRQVPRSSSLPDFKNRMADRYWRLLESASKQRKNHIVHAGAPASRTTLREAIAHEPRNPYGYLMLARWAEQDGDLHAAGGYYARCAERAKLMLPHAEARCVWAAATAELYHLVVSLIATERALPEWTPRWFAYPPLRASRGDTWLPVVTRGFS